MVSLAVEKGIRVPTLRPYLDSRGPLHLRISLVSEDIQTLEKTPFPFLVMSESDPLACLIEARFITDAHSELRRVFLLVQRDRYLLRKDEWRPITNLDVEDAWQKAFSFFREKGEKLPFMVLSEQMTGNGKLMPLQSLFFCKTCHLFFAPPCPKCGRPLEQCYEDDLLSRLGLQPYSASLKRYLFCPVCYRIGPSDFYVYELESSDVPGLKDRWDLMKAFRLFFEATHPPSPFPCMDCSRRQECYGSNLQVLSRLVPFSFYPFYAFILGAPSLHALDFLSLVAGASLDELEVQLRVREEGGRLSCLRILKQEGLTKVPFFFKGDERYFLEVFYLKLSFLGELFKIICSDDDLHRHPGLPLSIDRIWVALKDHGGLLPFFWNFRVRTMDIVGTMEENPPLPMGPTSHSLYFLGFAWFYALLVNGRQDVSTVRLSLRRMIDRCFLEKGFSFESFLKERSDSTFLPANIFWNPEELTVNTKGSLLWEKALCLGGSLFKAGLHQDSEWSMEAFWQDFENLREEMKSNLFGPEPVGDPRIDISETPEESKAIHAMLTKIIGKWRMRKESTTEELKETVLLASKRGAEPILPETVILSSSGALKKEPPMASSASFQEEPSSPEEIRPQGILSGKEEPFGGDFLTETVILGPGGRSSGSPNFPSEGKVSPPKEEEKTTILPKIEKGLEDGDFLAETVVQGPTDKPSRSQDKKRSA